MIMDDNGQWWTIIGWPWIPCNWNSTLTTWWGLHPSQIDQLLHPTIREDAKKQVIAKAGARSLREKTENDGYALKDAEFLLQKFQKEELNSLTSTRNCQNGPKWSKMIQKLIKLTIQNSLNQTFLHFFSTFLPKLSELGRFCRVFPPRRVQPWGRWSFARTRPVFATTLWKESKTTWNILRPRDLFHYPTHTYMYIYNTI